MMGRLRVNRNKAEQTNSNREGGEGGRRREGVRRSRGRRNREGGGGGRRREGVRRSKGRRNRERRERRKKW